MARLGPGGLFGEIGLLLTGRRAAAIVAETPMLLLTLFDQTFRRLSREHPEFADVVRSGLDAFATFGRAHRPQAAPELVAETT